MLCAAAAAALGQSNLVKLIFTHNVSERMDCCARMGYGAVKDKGQLETITARRIICEMLFFNVAH